MHLAKCPLSTAIHSCAVDENRGGYEFTAVHNRLFFVYEGFPRKALGTFTAVHGELMGFILFTWELREKAMGRRWFYVQLKRLLSELPPKSWRKLGGSVYLVTEEKSNEFDELLRRFKGPDLNWYKLRVET